MTRTFTTLFLGAVAVFAFGCGAPASQSAGPAAPEPSGAAEVGKCKTPEGAAAETASCAEGCTFDAAGGQCVAGTRGVTVGQKDDKKNKKAPRPARARPDGRASAFRHEQRPGLHKEALRQRAQRDAGSLDLRDAFRKIREGRVS